MSLHEVSSSGNLSPDDGLSDGSDLKKLISIHDPPVPGNYAVGEWAMDLSGRRKIARTLLAISDRLGSANPDQFDEQGVQIFGSTAFREVKS
jgi:hypothetical protein